MPSLTSSASSSSHSTYTIYHIALSINIKSWPKHFHVDGKESSGGNLSQCIVPLPWSMFIICLSGLTCLSGSSLSSPLPGESCRAMRIRHGMNIKEWEAVNPHSPQDCEDQIHDSSGNILHQPVAAAILPEDFKACTLDFDCFHGHKVSTEHGHTCEDFVKSPAADHHKTALKLFQVMTVVTSKSLDIPFIVVSFSFSEIKLGCHYYFLFWHFILPSLLYRLRMLMWIAKGPSILGLRCVCPSRQVWTWTPSPTYLNWCIPFWSRLIHTLRPTLLPTLQASTAEPGEWIRIMRKASRTASSWQWATWWVVEVYASWVW